MSAMPLLPIRDTPILESLLLTAAKGMTCERIIPAGAATQSSVLQCHRKYEPCPVPTEDISAKSRVTIRATGAK